MQETERALEALRDRFGFRDFRPGQDRVVAALLDGRSALAIFPTGGGKSLCYQLPALLFDGLTVVVSPLIALMKDQIDFLARCRVPAARLDSTLEAGEAQWVLADVRAGRIKLLYVAPERLGSERFLQMLQAQRISLLAIDEAHCISEWGHNFRPDYLKLAKVARRLGVGRVLALTATATPSVARNIAQVFDIQEDDVVLTGFHRPNLELHVTPCLDDEDRCDRLIERLKYADSGSTIVYVTLQQTAEDLAERLRNEGFDAEAYHAGLKDEDRHAIQDRFMTSDSSLVVATIAFGMGIDKSNIRSVYHANLPKSLENYVQEIGRAGRDGHPGHCELFVCQQDVIPLENFTYGDTPDPEAIEGFIREILGLGPVFDVSVYDLSQRHDIRQLVVQTLLIYLELEGIIEATGPFFDEYKFQPLHPSKEILARFDENRAEFLKRIFLRAQKGRTWFTLGIKATAEALNEPRERILAALNHLEEQGDLLLQLSGVRHGYRRTSREDDIDSLSRTLIVRFQERERRDIERVHDVLRYANITSCFTRHLLSHFGEILRKPCGHCAHCLGMAPASLPPQLPRELGAQEAALFRSLQDQNHPALRRPRQFARFLCGLTTPTTTRSKLAKHEHFGALRSVPFQHVLDFVNGQMTAR